MAEEDMVKSGYLPDLSGNFTRWRLEYREAMDSGKWAKASLALHNLNGCLDGEYRLPISTEMWQQEQDGYIVWECQYCTTTKKIKKTDDEGEVHTEEVTSQTRSKKEDIEIFDEKCSPIIKILSGRKTRRMWVCPNCGNIAPALSVSSRLMQYPKPHYRECIYEEPEAPKTSLMRNRGAYPTAMRKWTKNYSIELEQKLTRYRLEYIRQHGEDMEDATGFKDKGDK